MDAGVCSYASGTVWVFVSEFKVITPLGLSRSGQGEAAHPDLLTHYHITSPSNPSFLLTFLSLSLSYSFSFNLLSSKRAYQIVEVTFSLVN